MEVDSVNAVSGSLDGVKYHIWDHCCRKCDKGYWNSICLMYHDNRMHSHDVDGNKVEFRYTEPYSFHFAYRH